jgi:FkbM family methyltransferase
MLLTTSEGITLDGGSKFSYVTQELYKTGIYERDTKELLKGIIHTGDICVDAGANIGYFTTLMSKLGGQVTAFEPEPENFALLEKNMKTNNLEGNLIQKALSDVESEAILYKSDICSGMHRLYPSKHATAGEVKVSTVMLDNLFERIDVLKIDVEGMESKVLRGCTGSLPTHIICEFYPYEVETKENALQTIDILLRRGYAIRQLGDSNIYASQD